MRSSRDSQEQLINNKGCFLPFEIPAHMKTDSRFIVRSQTDRTDVYSSLKWCWKLAGLLNTCQSFFLARTLQEKEKVICAIETFDFKIIKV